LHSASGILLLLQYADFALVSPLRLKLSDSGSGESFGAARHESDSDSSDHALDLSNLRRSLAQHRGTIPMLDEFSTRAGEAIETDNWEKIRKIFDLPASESIITGNILSGARSDDRISCLVREECHDTRIYAPY